MQIHITEMSIEDYMDKYGNKYKTGSLWDYPLDELPHIVGLARDGGSTEIKLALIFDRLYEMEG